MVSKWTPEYIDKLIEGSKGDQKITVYDNRVDPYMKDVVSLAQSGFKQALVYPGFPHKLLPSAPIP